MLKLFYLIIAGSLIACNSETDHMETFKAYHTACNQHEIEKALSFLSDDFELYFTEYGMSMNKTQLKDALGWDKGVNGRTSYESPKQEGDSIRALFTETNDFFQLLGVEEIQAEVTYFFNADGLIRKQIYKSLPSQPSYQKQLEEAVTWARENKPDEIQQIYPDGQLRFNEEMGKLWVELLREWDSRDK